MMIEPIHYRENDILQSEGRLWRITRKVVVVTLDLVELTDTPVEPVRFQVSGTPDDPAFHFLTRLLPEGQD